MKVDFKISKLLRVEKMRWWVVIAAMIAIFVGVNYVAAEIPLRIDMSPGKAYTLSSSTKKILNNLQEKVTITLFISDDVPAGLIPLRTDVVDLVREYQREAGGNIIVQRVDPKKSEPARTSAQEYGIPELQLSQVERDAYAVSTVYFGIGLSAGETKASIPQATNLASLEYDLTSMLHKMTATKTPKIALHTASTQSQIPGDSTFLLQQILGQQFTIEDISSSTASGDLSISADTDAVVMVVNNNQNYTDVVDALSAYLEEGGNVVMTIDGVAVSPDLAWSPSQHGLFDFLGTHGILLQKDLIFSAASEIASFSTGTNSLILAYPLWIKTMNFDTSNNLFSNVPSLLFPWSSSIEIDKKDTTSSSESLVRTEGQSWTQQQDFTILPDAIAEPHPSSLSPRTVVAEATVGSQSGKLLVIGASNFIKDQFLQRENGNLDFMINILNDYTSDGTLSGIRARALAITPLVELAPHMKDSIKVFNIFALPGLFALLGGVYLWKRR